MNQVAFKKCVPLFVAILLIFSACTGNLGVNDSSVKSEQLIPMDQLDDLTLKIYCASATLLGQPMDQNDVMSFAETSDNVIVVAPAELKQHAELLGSLTSSALIPSEESFEMDARLYYVFENSNGESVFELVTNRYSAATAWVNGKEVANRKIFYEIIYPFLTEKALKTTGIPKSFYSGE